ncbi:MAG: TetR/AcrR family transcriptional regulator [bacterium]|nr:TetR/AcrR family transcriptional regulator [bacterium]
MRTRTFSEEEKTELKQKMKEAGWPMLMEQGLMHMSISKLTNEVGIGKSTFYNFYSSKEEFVEEMLDENRRYLLKSLKEGLDGRDKYSSDEAKALICNMICDANNVYKHFSVEDEAALRKMYEKNGSAYPNIDREKQVIDFLVSLMSGVKKDLDYAVISNLMKIIVLTSENREILHEEGYTRTKDALVELLLNMVFEESDESAEQ